MPGSVNMPTPVCWTALIVQKIAKPHHSTLNGTNTRSAGVKTGNRFGTPDHSTRSPGNGVEFP